MFESIINPIFSPFLKLSPLLSLLIISFIASLIIVIIYKLVTKQDVMKDLKSEIKTMQNEMKALKDNPSKMMEIQKKAMSKNLEYMKHSFKPTLITFLPLILIFGWLNGNLAYIPILPNTEFTVTAVTDPNYLGEKIMINVPENIVLLDEKEKVIQKGYEKIFPPFPFKREIGKTDYKLKGKEGDYLLDFNVINENIVSKELLVDKIKYKELTTNFNNNKIKKVTINNEKRKLLNLFGWKLGWLGTYILFSIVFSILLRKLFKVH